MRAQHCDVTCERSGIHNLALHAVLHIRYTQTLFDTKKGGCSEKIYFGCEGCEKFEARCARWASSSLHFLTFRSCTSHHVCLAPFFTESVGVAQKQTLDKCRDTENATTRTEGTCA